MAAHKPVGGWYAGSFGWLASEAGNSLMEERARRKSLVGRWLALDEIERTCGFRGRPSANRDASNSLDLADQEIDRLTLEREEDEELEQARSKRQLARVTNR